MDKKKAGRPSAADPKTFRYTFRLNQEQEVRFRRMIEQADCSANVTHFILARLFG